MKSKYLGTKIGKWKVTGKETAASGHNIYTLKMKKGFRIYTMQVRDNEMTKFSKGKTVEMEQVGKDFQKARHIRVEQNTVVSDFSILNLFKAI